MPIAKETQHDGSFSTISWPLTGVCSTAIAITTTINPRTRKVSGQLDKTKR